MRAEDGVKGRTRLPSSVDLAQRALEPPLPGGPPPPLKLDQGHHLQPREGPFRASANVFWTPTMNQVLSTPWRDTGDPTRQKPHFPGAGCVLRQWSGPGSTLWPRPRPSRAGPAALGTRAGAGEARRAWGVSGRGEGVPGTKRLGRATVGSRPNAYNFPGEEKTVF